MTTEIKWNHEGYSIEEILGLTEQEMREITKDVNRDNITEEFFAISILAYMGDVNMHNAILGVILQAVYPDQALGRPSHTAEMIVRVVQDQEVRKHLLMAINHIMGQEKRQDPLGELMEMLEGAQDEN